MKIISVTAQPHVFITLPVEALIEAGRESPQPMLSKSTQKTERSLFISCSRRTLRASNATKTA